MKPKIRKTLTGKVVKNKMNKTATVVVENKFKHPLYGKFIVKSTKYHVHDENNECSVEDLVSICETKPYSKLKSWNLVSILKHNSK